MQSIPRDWKLYQEGKAAYIAGETLLAHDWPADKVSGYNAAMKAAQATRAAAILVTPEYDPLWA